MSLNETLEAVLEALAMRKNDEKSYVVKARALVEQQLPAELQALVGDKCTVDGSVGIGNPASVPWCAVFLHGQKPTATEGTYVVYLFAADGDSVYLTLGQATSNVSGFNKKSLLRKRAADRRNVIGNPDGYLHTVTLNSRTPLGRSYEDGVVLAIEYKRGQVPSDPILQGDLSKIMVCDRKVSDSGIDAVSDADSMHLILRWSSAENQDTIQLHDEIARSKGSVWWGKISVSRNPGISASRIEAFKQQIALGLKTHVYLVQGDRSWVAELLDITLDPSLVSEDDRPSYYSKDDCTLFLRLGPISRLDEDIKDILVMEANPEPKSVEQAFKGQGTLFYAYEVWRAGMSTSSLVSNPKNSDLGIEGLAKRVHWPLAEVQEAIDVLQGSAPQIVLSGAPGTSKTYVAEEFANFLTGGDQSRITTVQFHPSYGYEDFIEGLRPTSDASGNINFQIVKGHLLRLIEDMGSNSERHVLIIDELNRANVPKVMGELLYLLEYRGRTLKLMNSGDFSLPLNLSIIATMNTSDRSTVRLDSALRRRFTFFDCPPSIAALTGYFDSQESSTTVSDLPEGFEKLNNRISNDLDEHHQIGHTFFMKQELGEEDLRRIWRRQILPQLAEYFYDQPELLASYTPEEFWPSLAN